MTPLPHQPVDPREATVLVVEDEEMVLQVIVKVLRKMGVPSVLEARNGEDAWRIIAEYKDKINLVICDWNMPRMTGIALLRKIRGEALGIRFMMLTGRSEMTSVAAAKEAGADAFAFKPYSPSHLMKKLTALLWGDAGEEEET